MSGIGRGRGWLNVTAAKAGAATANENKLNYDFNKTVIKAAAPKLTSAKTKYANILTQISMFSESEDTVLMNQNLKMIMDEFSKACQSNQDVHEVFNIIHEKCFDDDGFREKVIAVMCMPSFAPFIVHGTKVRNLFVTQLQNDYENAKHIQTSRPHIFRTNIKMFGEFYKKGRIGETMPLRFLSQPMLKYLSMLLESGQEVDVELLTLQLCMNGNRLREEQPTQLRELLVQVREQLVRNELCTARTRLWLLLILDVAASDNFHLPPSDLYKYYVTQLGDEAIGQLKRVSSEAGTHTGVQMMSMDVAKTSSSVSSAATVDDSDNVAGTLTTARTYRKPEASLTNIGTWEQPKAEKTPRPILGAGVRLTKKGTDDSADDWTDAPNWDNNKWSNEAYKVRKHVPKGWNHDDRFDQDYH